MSLGHLWSQEDETHSPSVGLHWQAEELSGFYFLSSVLAKEEKLLCLVDIHQSEENANLQDE